MNMLIRTYLVLKLQLHILMKETQFQIKVRLKFKQQIKIKTEVQLKLTDEIQTEIQSVIEKFVFLGTEFKETDSVICVDTEDVDKLVNVDANSKNIKNQNNAIFFGDGQIDFTKNIENNTMDIERIICNVEKRYFSTINLDTKSITLFKTKYFAYFEKKEQLKDREISCGPLSSDNGIPNFKPNYAPQDKVYEEIPVDFAKVFNDLEKQFEHCRIKLTPSDLASNMAISAQSDENLVPNQTAFNQNADNVEETTSLNSNDVQKILVVDNIDTFYDSDSDLL